LICITGLLRSNFAFIGLALLFLYGRVLGMSAANILAASLAIFYLILSGLHATQIIQPLPLQEACLFASLNLLALGLMLLLVRMNTNRVHTLLEEMSEQEMQLRHSESIKRKVLDWMPSGLLVADLSGRIATINPQALAWAQLNDIRQAISRPLAEIFPALHTLWEGWDGHTSLRSEFTHSNLLFGATLSYLPDAQGTLILFTDITRIKELEHQVQEMEKMASVGQLAAGLAHEIKNPLSGIKAGLQLLPSASLPLDKRQHLYRIIENDIQRLNHLLTHFLAFARPKQAKALNVNLAETVRSCLLTFQTEFAHVDFQLDHALEERYWHWDVDHLHQVLLNLLINAAQAASDREDPSVAIIWGREHATEYIAIKDNGPGLDPDIVGRTFDPFVTTKAQGSGLGLSIAQRLAYQNHARITLTQNAEPEAGVTARIITRCTAQNAETDNSSIRNPEFS
jgi:signal transduction histidine kinase